MKFKAFLFFILLLACHYNVYAQNSRFKQVDESGKISTRNGNAKDSLGSDKVIPIGIKVWTVDNRFGDRTMAQLDTIPHGFMNTVFTTGQYGEYNTTGNLGAPRINRIFVFRPTDEQFIFTQSYDFFVTSIDKFKFTNTLSPFTNITYYTAGNRTNGDDHFTAKFGVNAGKKIGVGFKFDYIYGRGYYDSQSTSHFNYTMYGSYLGERYQAHLLLSTNHQKVAENGGITNDMYITNPESFSDNFTNTEIPTVLTKNWNRNDNQHLFFTQRYSVGFNHKVPMTAEEIKAKKFAIESKKENNELKAKKEKQEQNRKMGLETDENEDVKEPVYAGRPSDAKVAGNEPVASDSKSSSRIAVNGKSMADSLEMSKKEKVDTSWTKNEYVPVTSFIHTLKIDNYRRIFQAYAVPDNYYNNTYYTAGRFEGDSIYDRTRHYDIKNTFAISLLEGFNKWAKAGIKAFVTSDLRHFVLPDSIGGENSYNEHNISIGGQLSKTLGKTFHYNALLETWLTGEDAGQMKLDGAVDLNFPLFGDTVRLNANGFMYRLNPTFYYRHYHSKHFWWDNNGLNKIIWSRVQGIFSYDKTRTTVRIAFDEIKNYTYFAMSYKITDKYSRSNNTLSVNQEGDAMTIFTLQLSQNFTLGPLNWDNIITYQKATKEDVIPVPDFNVYSNLYFSFHIAHVLKCDVGADVRYFSKYYAPDYSPSLCQYAVQSGNDKVKVGDYPLVNAYANFHLKHTRFFVMFSHVNSGSGNKDYFYTPHYPLNARILRFGVSWNFFN